MIFSKQSLRYFFIIFILRSKSLRTTDLEPCWFSFFHFFLLSSACLRSFRRRRWQKSCNRLQDNGDPSRRINRVGTDAENGNSFLTTTKNSRGGECSGDYRIQFGFMLLSNIRGARPRVLLQTNEILQSDVHLRRFLLRILYYVFGFEGRLFSTTCSEQSCSSSFLPTILFLMFLKPTLSLSKWFTNAVV